MNGINICLSEKVCVLLTWLQSSWKPFEVYILEMGVNRKFDFKQAWKFCWDISNVISAGGNWLFRWDCGGALYPSVNYGISSCWQDFLMLRLLIIFSTSLQLVFLKWKVESKALALILTILGCLSKDLTTDIIQSRFCHFPSEKT